MSSFLRSVVSLRGREGVVKESLTSQLSFSVKEIQLEQANEGLEEVTSNYAQNSLCTVLEAMFIHGLKDTFLNRVSQAIGGDPDQRPEPSFWGPLLIFSHREIIDQINMLSLITTDVGRCRAWLRLALNDCLLSRYLEAMRRDGSALRPYYRHSAFIRDTELLDVAQRLIEGIETLSFNLACNSSLLNVWTNQPLLMAGLWTPPLRACPVMSGVDVASTLDDNMAFRYNEECPPSPAVSLSQPSSSVGQLLNEDEALKIILGTPVDEASLLTQENIAAGGGSGGKSALNVSPSDDAENNGNELSEARGTDIPARSKDQDKEGDDDGPSSVGNSLIGRVGWSSSFEEFPSNGKGNSFEESDRSEKSSKSLQSSTPAPVPGSKVAILRSPTDIQSYHSLVESYNTLSGGYIKTPDLREFCQRFEASTESAIDTGLPQDDPFSPLYGLGFEVVPTSPTSLFDIPEFTSMVQQLGKLAKEPGLDTQNYTCKGCGHPVGMNFGKARVCSFGGGYYCAECHVGEEWIIPARVVHNWDFRRYAVAKKSAAFLDEIQHHPLLDLKVLNPSLYLAVEEMAQLQTLRIQLNLLRAYLFTCREPIIEDLQKRVWPREYLYEHVHLYSVSDLLQIPSGGLAQLLQKVVAFARNHVLSCWLCSQKGFICEICNNSKVIYPFDIESTYRCNVCSAVFHIGCLNASKPCPKCERRQKREDLPLLEAVET
ncbi:hypothetical protein R5R35_004907 [Gryllus longicercus]|uniref:RUN domain-containing protein n=1 Tax=Gryllus longicercus TaxID=2509291 RepID=A0AAN9VTF0_9ORTH